MWTCIKISAIFAVQREVSAWHHWNQRTNSCHQITIQSLKSSAHFEIALQCPRPSLHGHIVVSSLVLRPALLWLTPGGLVSGDALDCICHDLFSVLFLRRSGSMHCSFPNDLASHSMDSLVLGLPLGGFLHPHSGASTGGHGKSAWLWIARSSGLVIAAFVLASSAFWMAQCSQLVAFHGKF